MLMATLQTQGNSDDLNLNLPIESQHRIATIREGATYLLDGDGMHSTLYPVKEILYHS